jgi:hypothetical protein
MTLQVRGILNLKQWNVAISPAGLGLENDYADEDQRSIVNDRRIFSSERMLRKDYNRKCSVGK